VDGLVVGRHDVWVVVGDDEDEDVVSLLLAEESAGSPVPLRLCRAVRPDGTVVLGPCDPRQDRLLSRLLEDEVSGSA
jgi:hypothetical protein